MAIMFDVFRSMPSFSGGAKADHAPAPLKKRCELCPSPAHVFCDADSAFLCGACDIRVHTANFLVSRHVRVLLCSECQGETSWRACGGRPGREDHRCKSCEEMVRRLTAEEDQCVPSGGVDSQFPSGGVESQCRLRGLESQCPLGGVQSRGFSGGLNSDWLTLGPVSVEEQAVPENRAWGVDAMQDEQPAISPSGSSAVSGLSEERGATATPSSVLSGVPRVGQKRRAYEMDGQAGQGPWKSQRVHQEGSRPPVPLPPHHRVPSSRQKSELAISNTAVVERLERTLARWYVGLHLNSPETIPLSMHIFRKVLQSLQPNLLAAEAMRVTLAGCLWLATKVDTAQVKVPKASEVAAIAGVQASRLSGVELKLLTLLDWRLLEGWVGRGEVLDR